MEVRMSEDAFLRAILAQPNDDNVRLVYADWLEEQGDPGSASRAEFLRLTAELGATGGRKGWRKALRKQLQKLAAELDTDWLAVVSRLAVENCQGRRPEGVAGRRIPLVRFDFLCDRRWEDMRPTEDGVVRFCDGCRQNVHYCDTIMKARQHAQRRHCITVDLGVIRREDDLAPRRTYLGRPSVERLRREEERLKPDAVSAARQRRKRKERRAERES
jgi:uncharacterized protein (TIGR02996 family)